MKTIPKIKKELKKKVNPEGDLAKSVDIDQAFDKIEGIWNRLDCQIDKMREEVKKDKINQERSGIQGNVNMAVREIWVYNEITRFMKSLLGGKDD